MMLHLVKEDFTPAEVLGSMVKYVKKPIPIHAVAITQPFEVETLEGTMRGNMGDYLVVGIHGEVYPCAKGIFEESYQEVH